ncbi:MAG: hypothetical protein A2098_02815 [Chlamydiae bacterium GWF2_49_8]|nr:MAG: hypothetical protein A2098_02815 [Chlamydiae bacterium GWF2_49_8]
MKIHNKWTKAEEGPDNSVIYIDEDGNRLKRFWKAYEGQPVEEASTRSWRNNNPGNHSLGPFARRNGAIGGAGKIPNKKNLDLKFAVYPDYETGRKAQALRLKEGTIYINLTLNEFVRKYVGVEKGEPDTKEVTDYRKAIKIFTKLDMDRTIRSLNDKEYEKLLDAMKKHEGWREGREEYTDIKKVLGVHVNKQRVIFEFLIESVNNSKWVAKKEAIALTEAGELYAIVVHAQKESYLRPKFHQPPFSQMIVT